MMMIDVDLPVGVVNYETNCTGVNLNVSDGDDDNHDDLDWNYLTIMMMIEVDLPVGVFNYETNCTGVNLNVSDGDDDNRDDLD